MDTNLSVDIAEAEIDNLDLLLTVAMIRHPLVVTTDMPAIEALRLMSNTTSSSLSTDGNQSWLAIAAQASCVLVMENSQLVGICTEQDVVRWSAEGRNLSEVSMGEVMTYPVITLKYSQLNHFSVLLNLFCQHQIRHLPIVDDHGLVTGLITYESLINAQSSVKQSQLQSLNSLDNGNVQADQGVVTEITVVKQTQPAFRNSDHRYVALTENAPVGIFYTDHQGNCQYVNPKWEEITGLTMAEALGTNWSQALHPDDRDRVIDEWYSSVTNQQPFLTECRYQNPQGKVIWAVVRATPTTDSTGNCIGYVGTITDISEQQAALRERQRIARQLELQNCILARIARGEPLTDVLHTLIAGMEQQFDGALFCIMLLDEENRLRHGASLNLPPDYVRIGDGMMIGEGVGSCGTAAYRQQVVIVSDIANDPLWKDFKDLALSYDLRACWSAPIIASDSQMLGTFAVYYRQVKTPQPSDIETITLAAYIAGIAIERQRSVIALQKSESFLRAIYEDVEQAIFALEIDSQGEYRYVAWNPVSERFTGISFLEIQGKTPQEVFCQSCGQSQSSYYETCVKLGKPFSYEEYITNFKTNRSYWILITLKPLRDESGRIYRLIGTGADITGRKRAEEYLRTLVEGTATVTGTEFFSALVRYTAKALDAPYVLVSELMGDRLHTLGFFADEELQPPISYNIACTPCEKALSQGIYYCPRNVIQEFPQDFDLQGMQAQSYLGVALWDNNGVVIGNLCILNTRPIEEPERLEATLRVFAARAAAELARQRATEALQHLNEELETKVIKRTAALQESEARFRATFEQANVGMIEADLQGRFTRMNQKFCEIVGYSEAELLGRSFTSITHPEDITVSSKQIQYLLSGAIHTFAHEKRYIHKQSHCVWAYVTISLVRSLSGEPEYLIGVIQDISDRKHAEEILQKQAQRERLLRNITQHIRQSLDLESILSAAVNEIRQTFQAERALIFRLMPNGSGVVLEESVVPDYPSIKSRLWQDECSPHELYQFYRDGNVRIVTDTQNDLWGECLAEFMAEAQVQSKIVAPIAQKLDNQPPRVWGLISIHACGKKRQWQTDEANLLQQIASQLSVAIQQADLYQQVQTELSDRKRAEAALSELNEQLLHTNHELARATRLKDEFLASMSHELRTPLNAILGMSEGLLDGVFGNLTEKQQRALTTIERSGKHLLELINDILDLAKIEAGKLELEIAPIAVNYLCESSLAFVKQMASQKQIQLRLNIQNTVQDIAVDERRMRQVLINLLNNAVKFTPEGGSVILAARRERIETYHTQGNTQSPTSQSSDWISFAVIDTGIGIAPEDMGKLFQSFVQIDSRLNRQYTGTGLGLALVRQIAELHGGNVTVSSEVGKGSCFTVRLPDTYQKFKSPQLTPDVKSAEVRQSPIDLTTESPLILLAEDNQANIETISSYLESRGYRLILASDGETSVDLARSQHPSLILMDIQMPGIDGLEAIRRIRQHRELAQVPIVALTALAMPGDRERCLQAGANEYVNKPVKLRELTSIIQNLLTS